MRLFVFLLCANGCFASSLFRLDKFHNCEVKNDEGKIGVYLRDSLQETPPIRLFGLNTPSDYCEPQGVFNWNGTVFLICKEQSGKIAFLNPSYPRIYPLDHPVKLMRFDFEQTEFVAYNGSAITVYRMDKTPNRLISQYSISYDQNVEDFQVENGQISINETTPFLDKNDEVVRRKKFCGSLPAMQAAPLSSFPYGLFFTVISLVEFLVLVFFSYYFKVFIRKSKSGSVYFGSNEVNHADPQVETGEVYSSPVLSVCQKKTSLLPK